MRNLIVRCPYCRTNNSYAVPDSTHIRRYDVIHCDHEEGGCDRPFVIEVIVEIKANGIPMGSTSPVHNVPAEEGTDGT